jgi:drug/metabolite transporter (DMT)-like permease
MEWVLLSVVSVVGFTGMTVVQKRALDHYVNGAVTFNAVASMMQLAVAVVLLTISPIDDWFSRGVLLMVAAGTLQALQWLLQLYALNRATDVSRIVPIMDSFPLVVLIISVVLLGEVLTPIKWLAVLMVVGGAVLASLSQAIPGERVRMDRSFAAIIGAMLGMALLTVLFKLGSEEDLALTQMLGLAWLFAAPVHLIVARIAHAGADVGAALRSRAAVGSIGFTQLLMLVAFMAGLGAISLGPLSLTTAIMGTRPVMLLLWFMASGFSVRKALRGQPGQSHRKQWASASLVTAGVGAMAF